MIRARLNFADFKTAYMSSSGFGYYPVYVSLTESSDSVFLPIFNLDMICEWRLPDGKIKFIQVPYETKEEFEEMKEYLRKAAEALCKAITERIDRLLMV